MYLVVFGLTVTHTADIRNVVFNTQQLHADTNLMALCAKLSDQRMVGIFEIQSQTITARSSSKHGVALLCVCINSSSIANVGVYT